MRGEIGMMSQLETCDLCHEIHPLRKVHFDGHQFLCRKCRETPKVKIHDMKQNDQKGVTA